MDVLVTGAAGFIGYHCCRALLKRGGRVIGIDNLNDYYDVGLKQSRLDNLTGEAGFAFRKLDVADHSAIEALAREFPDVGQIVHLAAQPGVRYSLVNPYAYVRANVLGQVAMLELARKFKHLEHFVYASSSSVYGGSTALPFSIADRADTPVSLYAATKRAGELVAHTYSHLYGMPTTGLRFFTVYGPWGRPDMAPMLFAKAIVAGEPIRVFNRGEMWRDFTYVDDIVNGIVRSMARASLREKPYALYNLGNHKSEKLTDFIAILENLLGRKARIVLEPMQPGDIASTYADIEDSRRDFGFEPTTDLRDGLGEFVAWYRSYYRV